VFNPWGFDTYTADWSDESTKWTSAFKTEAGFQKSDDGISFMSFEEYYELFRSTNINFDSSNWHRGSFLKLNDTS